jgi:uncharacterized membrane protein
MRRTIIFLSLTVLALISLVAITIAGFYILNASPYPQEWIDQMGSMMTGEMSGHMPTQNSIAPYFGLMFVVLVGITIAGISGMTYFIVLPEIRTTKRSNLTLGQGETALPIAIENQLSPYDAVLRILNQNERKVVEVLKGHDGSYLQKYIRNDTGLSRLQTHRIVAHLVQMGIVTAEQRGNTNIVILEPWLMPKKA